MRGAFSNGGTDSIAGRQIGLLDAVCCACNWFVDILAFVPRDAVMTCQRLAQARRDSASYVIT